MKGFVFLVNPAAGSGRAGEVWQGLLDSHPERHNQVATPTRQQYEHLFDRDRSADNLGSPSLLLG